MVMHRSGQHHTHVQRAATVENMALHAPVEVPVDVLVLVARATKMGAALVVAVVVVKG